jgi:hypothetical protein
LVDALSSWAKGSKMPKNHNSTPPYPPEFRQQMVELDQARCLPSKSAKEFGSYETSIPGWVARPTATTPLLAMCRSHLIKREHAEVIDKATANQHNADVHGLTTVCCAALDKSPWRS